MPPEDVDIGDDASLIGSSLNSYIDCAMLSDGSLRCWGHNAYGQLGLANTKQIGDNETPIMAGLVPF